VSGRQRMLSQRIAKAVLSRWVADELGEDSTAHRKELSEALDLFTESHRRLLRGNLTLSRVENSGEVSTRLAELTPFVNRIAVSARELLRDHSEPGSPASERALEDLFDAEAQFLPRMNELVGIYELEAKLRVQQLEEWEKWILLVVLSILVLEALLIFEPLTRRLTRQLRDLKLARNDALAASAVKEEFLTSMSHEVRTPLTAILGFADILADPSEPASQKAEALGLVQHRSRELLSLVETILDLSNLDSPGGRKEAASEVDPVSTLRQLLAAATPMAKHSGIELDFRIGRDVPARFVSNPRRLTKVLQLLLEFAVGGPGGPAVQLSCSGSPNGDRIEFMLSSGASEWSKLLAAKISATTLASEHSGVGAKVYVVHRITESLGGRLDSADQSVVLAIPVEQVANPQNLRPQKIQLKGPKEHALSDVHVLYAEDGPDNQRLVRHILSRHGATVKIVENGKLAVDEVLAGESVFDVVLMDMQMPVMDGYEATRRLTDQCDDLPIIALTAHNLESDRDRCLEAGCDEYLTKPICKTTLVETVAHFAQRTPS
ncbi:MAG: response regulator, partial [Planctomycetota bacterium]